ncbi:MAG: hypothetical protein CMP10_17485 [Zetaproteobacteria bacterium]|nr:hypothetical protein [Pseudobdellovibrionaceae bacterium]
MVMKLSKFYLLIGLSLIAQAMGCSGEGSSDSESAEPAPLPPTAVQQPGTPNLPISDPNVDTDPAVDINTSPTISHITDAATVTLNTGEFFGIEYSAVDDQSIFSVTLYSSATSLECSESSISAWTLYEASPEAASSFNWSSATAGVYYLCLEASDGELKSFSKLPLIFNFIPADKALWLKADEGVEHTDNTISRWADLSGNGIDFINSSETSKPTLNSGSLNGLPTVYFDGVDDFLGNTSSYDAKSALIVFKVSSAVQNTAHLGEIWGDYAAGIHVSVDARSLYNYSFDGNATDGAAYYISGNDFGSSTRSTANNGAWEYDTLHFMTTQFDETKTLTQTNLAHINTFAVGNHHFGGELAEVMIFDRELTSAERLSLNLYLKEKWSEESPAQPTKPANLTTGSLYTDSASISWDADLSSAISYYFASREGSVPPSACNGLGYTATSNTSMLLKDLKPQTQYHVKVCAVNLNGLPYLMSEAAEVSFTTPADGDTPTPVMGNLLNWFNSNGGITQSASKVSQWQDMVSDAVLKQDTVENQPAYGTGSYNEVSFDGSTSFLSSDSALSMKNAFIVFKVSDENQERGDLGTIFGNYDDGSHVGVDPRNGNLQGFSFDGDASQQASYSLDMVNYTTSARNANGQPWSYDKVHVLHVNYDNLQSLTSFHMGRILKSGLTNHFYGGSIMEVLVYDQDLTAEELGEMKEYFNYAWGLSL